MLGFDPSQQLKHHVAAHSLYPQWDGGENQKDKSEKIGENQWIFDKNSSVGKAKAWKQSREFIPYSPGRAGSAIPRQPSSTPVTWEEKSVSALLSSDQNIPVLSTLFPAQTQTTVPNQLLGENPWSPGQNKHKKPCAKYQLLTAGTVLSLAKINKIKTPKVTVSD